MRNFKRYFGVAGITKTDRKRRIERSLETAKRIKGKNVMLEKQAGDLPHAAGMRETGENKNQVFVTR
jgi:hypothetical protein